MLTLQSNESPDTFPSYLLFQTLLTLFWTLTCMIWMELTRTNVVFSRIAIVLILCRNKSSQNDLKTTEIIFGIYKKYWRKNQCQGPTPYPWGWGRAPLPRGPPVATPTSTPTPYIRVWGERMKEKDSSRFMIRSRHQALISLGRADLESVQGYGEGNPSPSSSSTFLHHQFHDAHRRAWVIPS